MALYLPGRLHRVDPYRRDSGPASRAVLADVMLTTYCFILMDLWTLCTFQLSFCSLDPLFSSSYELFRKNTGGGMPAAQGSGK
jgi:hypothetical protein